MKNCSKCSNPLPADHYDCYCYPCRREYRRQWRKRNPDKKRRYNEAWRAKNPRHKYTSGWYEKNKDHVRKTNKAWRYKNHSQWKKAHALRTRNRRSKLKGADGDFRFPDIIDVWNSQDGRCVYCAKQLGDSPEERKYHIDHITPISRGGGNDPGNLQCLCPPCNLAKGSMTDEEYRLAISAG